MVRHNLNNGHYGGRKCKGPCQRELELEDFDRDSSKPDGYKAWCKDCRKVDQRSEAKSDIDKAIENLDAKALLLIKGAAGGTNLPHQTEALEKIVEILGGVGGFAAYYVGNIVAADPGSVTRERMLNKILSAIQLCSDDAKVQKPRHLMSDEELRERSIKLLEGTVREAS